MQGHKACLWAWHVTRGFRRSDPCKRNGDGARHFLESNSMGVRGSATKQGGLRPFFAVVPTRPHNVGDGPDASGSSPAAGV